MKCIEKKELELFLKGKLDTNKLLAIDEHLSTCSDCKSALCNLAHMKNMCNDLGANLLGVADCPEYEKISAYVDGKLVSDEANAIKAHVNICEFCAKDIEQIEKMRYYSALQTKVTVKPGMTHRRAESPFITWKRALAALSVAAGVTVVALSLNHHNITTTGQPTQTAYKPSAPITASNQDQKPEMAVNTETPDTSINNEDNDNNVVAQNPDTAESAKPKAITPAAPKAVLKDGPYRVINKGNRLELAKADGTSVRTALEARIAAAIDEKLRTGKIKRTQPVQVAMNTAMRGGGYTPSSVAPKAVSPSGKILMSNMPTFRWSSIDMADTYRLIITDEAGNVVLDKTTKNTSLTLDRPLPRGKAYMWRVGVKFDESESWSNSAAAKFGVLSSDGYSSIKQVKRQLPGSHLALGAAYDTFGLHDEAAREYNAVKRANGHSQAARKIFK